ncbi:MAG: DUF2304 domain-containing protein [Erysipelotrichales bacterium]|nr:DUF2304 domain-containing protein [Erysipelotrichales bacterium]
MLLSLQTSLIIGSLTTLIFVVVVAKKTRMNIRYAIVWILWCFIIVILSLFPSLIDFTARVLSISTPTNAIFLIFIFLVYLISFYLFIKVSHLNENIKLLTYECAELRRKIESNEK